MYHSLTLVMNLTVKFPGVITNCFKDFSGRAFTVLLKVIIKTDSVPELQCGGVNKVKTAMDFQYSQEDVCIPYKSDQGDHHTF